MLAEHAALHILQLVEAIKQQYRLDWHGIHGMAHWARVWENGMRLAEETGANTEVVGYFALFHDACRLNDGRDSQHGKRGAELAAQWRNEFFVLNDEEFDLLYTACTYHTSGETEADPTIQTCWDADRLDLGRVGITPVAHRLCTAAAKRAETIAWAINRACYSSDINQIAESWMGHVEYEN